MDDWVPSFDPYTFVADWHHIFSVVQGKYGRSQSLFKSLLEESFMALSVISVPAVKSPQYMDTH